MRKNILIAAVVFIIPFISFAQQPDYRVVFDLTSKDSLDQRAVIRWLNEVTKGNPDAKVEVVMYGQGFNLVLKGHSPYEEAVSRLAANKNVAFRACAIALKNNNVDKSLLLPGVETVPDGIYEIISKQREGWGYIKAVH
jgi:intracellular sulfur oxidation DsrE/DsrF family protein